MATDSDYVLGTGDDEIARLGLQHRVWRDHAMQGWRRAGFAADHTLGPTRPLLDIMPPAHPMWAWMRAFVETGRRRLTQSGRLAPGRADAIWNARTAVETAPSSLMVTPGVIEIAAVRR